MDRYRVYVYLEITEVIATSYTTDSLPYPGLCIHRGEHMWEILKVRHLIRDNTSMVGELPGSTKQELVDVIVRPAEEFFSSSQDVEVVDYAVYEDGKGNRVMTSEGTPLEDVIPEGSPVSSWKRVLD